MADSPSMIPLTIEGRIQQYGALAEGMRRAGVRRLAWWFAGAVVLVAAMVALGVAIDAVF